MKQVHENLDINSSFNIFSKQSTPKQYQMHKTNPLHQSESSQSENLSDYSQDDFSAFDQNINSSKSKFNQIEIENNIKSLQPHDYSNEITDFVNRASELYSEENITFLKKELNSKGLILSFKPPSFNCWQCVICSDNSKDPVVYPCGHIFCKKCIEEWEKHSTYCPVCRSDLEKEKAIKIRSFLDTSPKKK